MINKLTALLPQLFSKARSALGKIPMPIKALGAGYCLFVILVLLLYLGLFMNEYIRGITHAGDLLAFINILIGSSMVAFVTFIVGLCIDSDGDGVPDSFEKEAK